jgi:hypothetical protein
MSIDSDFFNLHFMKYPNYFIYTDIMVFYGKVSIRLEGFWIWKSDENFLFSQFIFKVQYKLFWNFYAEWKINNCFIFLKTPVSCSIPCIFCNSEQFWELRQHRSMSEDSNWVQVNFESFILQTDLRTQDYNLIALL